MLYPIVLGLTMPTWVFVTFFPPVSTLFFISASPGLGGLCEIIQSPE